MCEIWIDILMIGMNFDDQVCKVKLKGSTKIFHMLVTRLPD